MTTTPTTTNPAPAPHPSGPRSSEPPHSSSPFRSSGPVPPEPGYVEALRLHSVPLLRVALAVVFVWFGALKVANVSPVGDLVAGTVPWFDPAWFVPLLGVFEVIVGLLLLSGRAVRWTCAAMMAHLGGTFLVYLMQPDVAFVDGNPLLMTTEGEFVAKNIVLIAAGLVIAVWSHRPLRHQA